MTALGNRVAMETVQRPVNSISEFSEVEKTTGPMRYGLGPSPDGYRQAADCRAELVALFCAVPNSLDDIENLQRTLRRGGVSCSPLPAAPSPNSARARQRPI